MEIGKNYKKIGIAAVLVAVLGLTIAFAALSQTLNINGTGKVAASTWDIVWEEIDNQTIVPSSGVEVQSGFPKLDTVTLVKDNTTQLTGTTLDLGTITLHKPGDNATFRINIANIGDINAKITGVTGVSVNNTYVEYSVKYLNSATNVTTDLIGRLLEPNDRKLVIIEVKFKDSVTTEQYNQIPQNGIEVSLNGVSITYTQDDGTGVADTTTQAQSGYSFTLNEFAGLEGAFWDDSTLVAPAANLWTLINADLSNNSSYYVVMGETDGTKLYNITSNSNALLAGGYNEYAAGPSAGVEYFMYLASGVSDSQNRFIIQTFGVNNNSWADGPKTEQEHTEFLNNYGNVVITFQEISN